MLLPYGANGAVSIFQCYGDGRCGYARVLVFPNESDLTKTNPVIDACIPAGELAELIASAASKCRYEPCEEDD